MYILAWDIERRADSGSSLPACKMYVYETVIKCVDVSEGAEAPDTQTRTLTARPIGMMH